MDQDIQELFNNKLRTLKTIYYKSLHTDSTYVFNGTLYISGNDYHRYPNDELFCYYHLPDDLFSWFIKDFYNYIFLWDTPYNLFYEVTLSKLIFRESLINYYDTYFLKKHNKIDFRHYPSKQFRFTTKLIESLLDKELRLNKKLIKIR